MLPFHGAKGRNGLQSLCGHNVDRFYNCFCMYSFPSVSTYTFIPWLCCQQVLTGKSTRATIFTNRSPRAPPPLTFEHLNMFDVVIGTDAGYVGLFDADGGWHGIAHAGKKTKHSQPSVVGTVAVTADADAWKEGACVFFSRNRMIYKASKRKGGRAPGMRRGKQYEWWRVSVVGRSRTSLQTLEAGMLVSNDNRMLVCASPLARPVEWTDQSEPGTFKGVWTSSMLSQGKKVAREGSGVIPYEDDAYRVVFPNPDAYVDQLPYGCVMAYGTVTHVFTAIPRMPEVHMDVQRNAGERVLSFTELNRGRGVAILWTRTAENGDEGEREVNVTVLKVEDTREQQRREALVLTNGIGTIAGDLACTGSNAHGKTAVVTRAGGQYLLYTFQVHERGEGSSAYVSVGERMVMPTPIGNPTSIAVPPTTGPVRG